MERIDLTPAQRAWLARTHPRVDWSRVAFVRGLPWWALPKTRALVAPTLRGVRVHVRHGAALDDALLAHEAHHVLQYHEMGRAGFVARYLWLALRHGVGRAHPMEAPAYEAQRAVTARIPKAPPRGS